jgi:hypothetical protein
VNVRCTKETRRLDGPNGRDEDPISVLAKPMKGVCQ